jgi:hypothetical protein
MKHRSSSPWLLLIAAACLAATACASSGGGRGEAIITATLADVGNVIRGATAQPVVIHIERYSTPQEVSQLAQLLAEKGPDAVRERTWKLENGWIRVGDSLGYPLAVITRRHTGNGERIGILLDRPMGFYEEWRHLPTSNYPFGYIELNLGPDGHGDGQLTPAGQIRLANGGIEVVGYGLQPVRLLNAQVQRG